MSASEGGAITSAALGQPGLGDPVLQEPALPAPLVELPGARGHLAAPPAPGRTRVAAYAVCRDEAGRFLLTHLAPSVGVGDLWTLPGGGIEFGEAPADAVLRELLEETGYTGAIDRLVEVSDRLFTPADAAEPLHAIRVIYAVRLVGGDLRDEPDGSTDRAAWFAPADARRLRLGELARRMIEGQAGDA